MPNYTSIPTCLFESLGSKGHVLTKTSSTLRLSKTFVVETIRVNIEITRIKEEEGGKVCKHRLPFKSELFMAVGLAGIVDGWMEGGGV